jgi:GNAT superfamily N-acetyltransferase
MQDIRIRPVRNEDHSLVEKLIVSHWGSTCMVVHGEVFFPAELPGFLALRDTEICGLATYCIRENACEIMSLDAFQPGLGIGSLLIEAVKEEARAKGCARLHLVTTNDNLNALAFYQKRGFRLAALRPGALELSRKIKPEIPLVGENGIPIRDEIELEIDL